MKAFDDNIAFGHPLHADRQDNRNNSRQSFRNGRHRQTDRRQEEQSHFIHSQIPVAITLVNPQHNNKSANNDAGDTQNLAKLRQMLLQGRVAFFIAMHHFGNFADFRFYRTGNNHTSTTAVYDDRTHITQIFSIC